MLELLGKVNSPSKIFVGYVVMKSQVLGPSLSKGNRVMVFCNTLNSSRAVDHYLGENQLSTVNYHGEVPAEQRWYDTTYLFITLLSLPVGFLNFFIFAILLTTFLWQVVVFQLLQTLLSFRRLLNLDVRGSSERNHVMFKIYVVTFL